jgi:polysaccharide biosynthesis protein PslL
MADSERSDRGDARVKACYPNHSILEECAPRGRLLWVDVLKGIGILFVAAGHIYSGIVPDVLCLFHMPLFFFLSGFLHSVRSDGRGYLRSRLVSLGIPYVSFLCVLYPVQLWYLLNNAPILTARQIAVLIVSPAIGGKLLVGPCAVFWFISCLFLTQQVFNFFVSRVSLRVLGTICAVSLVIGYVISEYWNSVWLPLGANVVFGALPIYFLGFFFKIRKFEIPRLLCILVALVSTYFQVKGYPLHFDMKSGDYGIPVVSILCACSWTFVLISISRISARHKIFSACIGYIGKGSLVVMYLHQSIQLIMLQCFGVKSENVRFIAAVGVSLLANQLLFPNRYTRLLFLGLADVPTRNQVAEAVGA